MTRPVSKSRTSIGRRLAAGLALAFALGASGLLTAVFMQYRLQIQDLAGAEANIYAWSEVMDHVGIPVLALTLPAILTGAWVIRHSFRPMEHAARTIAETQAARGVRIDDRAMPSEVMPFVGAINGLLGRLDDAASEHEAFAADVAHQIRTPLAILKLALERPGGVSADILRGEVDGISRLVDQLLLLAQVNAQAAAPLPPMLCNLADIAADTAAAFAPLALAQGRQIAFEDGGGCGQVHCHREALASALRNLLDNALRVTPPGGTITVLAGGGAGAEPIVAVRDGGPGLAVADLARFVRRRGRVDQTSDRGESEGAGLGLAIVARIIAAHGGRLETLPGARELRLVFPQ
ncbi:ATP-binding protein [Novosphingobium sp. SL115]|uniref:ATP-binding protein n=1 Tax=Novosphingobium sp. SL115 TaxID=2995150 RepID=UPI0022738DDB|nr:ATP-binding protein [Novosphingobium sp. SL115]MCY1672080.1 ATP-binding protein [Novosphingobium sp. SL115]